MDTFEDPFFRGCTRPAMLLGVPLMPMLLTTASFALVGAWTAFLVSGYTLLVAGVVYVPLILGMRAVTREDDQRLHQLFLRARMRIGLSLTRRRWGAYSYSPQRYTSSALCEAALARLNKEKSPVRQKATGSTYLFPA
ncbi:type IV secretion system protein VirB3 [Duganella sp. BuS-21]|uniref:type IV secretion system protein VirB3 n=1 Tax=Duganella sp. BuS-21 TaxID=2943848 RepID=UPI0035A69A97